MGFQDESLHAQNIIKMFFNEFYNFPETFKHLNVNLLSFFSIIFNIHQRITHIEEFYCEKKMSLEIYIRKKP